MTANLSDGYASNRGLMVTRQHERYFSAIRTLPFGQPRPAAVMSASGENKFILVYGNGLTKSVVTTALAVTFFGGVSYREVI